MILGKLGEGYKIAIGSLNEGRIGIGAQMLGLAEGAFEAAMPYVHQRKQFGATIASFQMVQASMATVSQHVCMYHARLSLPMCKLCRVHRPIDSRRAKCMHSVC